MALAKRISLFLLVNILVVTVISFLLYIFNIQPFLANHGLDIRSLALFCLIWGMGGAFISLFMSKIMAKWMMGVQIISPETYDSEKLWLISTVHELSKKAGLPKMPEVGIYQSNDINAFATGPSKSNSLVAVSSGLLNRMDRDEAAGVIGHEITHIANGDMVTMTLLQGVINAFVMFLARGLAYVVTRALNSKDERSTPSPFMYHAIVMVLEIAFMILGSLVVARFSRYREFRADAGGAKLAGKEKMIKALVALKNVTQPQTAKNATKAYQALQISNRTGSFSNLFATHPPLDERIARLQKR
jgi:heat shock protein HtpX